MVTPTLAAGKGWGKFDVQATLGGTFPVNSVNKLGRTVLSNTAFQYHALKQLWPEVEINSTFWMGGTNDGKKQTFVTPGVVLGPLPDSQARGHRGRRRLPDRHHPLQPVQPRLYRDAAHAVLRTVLVDRKNCGPTRPESQSCRREAELAGSDRPRPALRPAGQRVQLEEHQHVAVRVVEGVKAGHLFQREVRVDVCQRAGIQVVPCGVPAGLVGGQLRRQVGMVRSACQSRRKARAGGSPG